MRVLFDHGTPDAISHSLTEHECTYARQVDWQQLKNGELILRAEAAAYDVLLSTDKNIRYQQNLIGRKIAIVVLGNPQWPQVKLYLDKVGDAIGAAIPGSYTEVQIPFK
jgi:hypothetical protein